MPHRDETDGLFVRPVEAADRGVWRAMWEDYVSAVGVDPRTVSTARTWARLNDPDIGVIGWVGGRAAGAAGAPGAAEGFVHCVIHANTFGERPVCYLEDLYVAPPARGSGLAGRLIDTVVDAARVQGWQRVYWHTMEDNYRARGLYDRYAQRTGFVRYDIAIGTGWKPLRSRL